MAEFDSLVAIVTGGASGIGAAVARRLAEGGATVAVFDLKPGGADRHFAVDVSDAASGTGCGTSMSSAWPASLAQHCPTFVSRRARRW